MEHALSTGAADLIGIGRPLCGAPDACRELLAGAEAIPRFERQLHLLPGWLRWLETFKMVRALAGLNLIGADLVEVSPPFDPSGGTAWVGASIMFELLCVLAPACDARLKKLHYKIKH